MNNRLLFAFVLLFLAACGSAPLAVTPTSQPASTPTLTCTDHAGPFKTLAKQWDDANTLASQSPRMSLAPQIAELQKIRRDTEALTASECTKGAQTALVQSVDATIEGYLAFLGQQPDTTVQIHFASAQNAMLEYQDELLKASGITPPPRTLLPLIPPTMTPLPVPTIAPTTTYQPTLIFSTQSVPVGEGVEIRGEGWPPRQYVEILLGRADENRRQLKVGVTSNDAGEITAMITFDKLPSGDGIAPGEYEAVGQIVGPTYRKLRIKQKITVTAP